MYEMVPNESFIGIWPTYVDNSSSVETWLEINSYTSFRTAFILLWLGTVTWLSSFFFLLPIFHRQYDMEESSLLLNSSLIIRSKRRWPNTMQLLVILLRSVLTAACISHMISVEYTRYNDEHMNRLYQQETIARVIFCAGYTIDAVWGGLNP